MSTQREAFQPFDESLLKKERSSTSLRSLSSSSLPKPPSFIKLVKEHEPDEISLETRDVSESQSDEQLELDEDELDEYFNRALGPQNPQQEDTLVLYSYKEHEFVPYPVPYNETVIIEIEGTSIHVDSPEAVRQAEVEYIDEGADTESNEQVEAPPEEPEGEPEEEEGEKKEAVDEDAGEGERGEGDGEGEKEGAEGGEDKMEEELIVPGAKKIKKKLTNKFNFSERAALTYSNITRDHSTQTIPPPSAQINAQATQWIIFDTYQADYEALMREKERERKERMIMQVKKEDTHRKKGSEAFVEDPVKIRMAQAAKILERMINQNTFDDIAQDCQYYDDPADKYRKLEGSVLPLWEFKYVETENLTVTDIYWNPYYYDLFGVTYGSLEFKHPSSQGFLCLYTLKNPSYPEFVATLKSGIMCLDFHPRKPYYIAVGLHNGSVAVFNIKTRDEVPSHVSTVYNKHTGIVWQVLWGDEPRERLLSFYSVSADGQVYKWGLLQTELARSPVITLYMEVKPLIGPDGNYIKLTACATCFTFQPGNHQIFMVGSAEGCIYKCSIAYASTYLFTYEAHSMPVHRINYNPFITDIFASCSDDWRVKIWEDCRSEPLFVFDLECSVGDVQWAPYSSTVFAAVTSDGNVQIYDLNLNKYDAVCIQIVICTQDNVLTRLQFNERLPILVVGDSSGTITSLKVSPNLRIKPKPPKKQGYIDPKTLELMKLEKVLSYVREPMTLLTAPDVETVAS